jgi:cytochrome c oxidase assembly protein subunit 15
VGTIALDRPARLSSARRLPAWLPLVAAALALIVVVASAYLRHAQAGLSCADWPACYARLAPPAAQGAADFDVRLARIAHRASATGVAVLVVVLVLLARAARGVAQRERALAAAAGALVVGLAALGVATPGTRLPAVTLANLLGGYALLAALTALHASARPAAAIARGARRIAGVALALAVVQVALGGMIAAQFAVRACEAFPGCGAWTWAEFFSGGAWNPLSAPAAVGDRILAPVGAAGLHVLHYLNGIALAGAVAAAAVALRATRPGLAWSLAIVLGAGIGSGFAAALLQSALALVVAHNAGAALLVALLARAVAGAAAAPLPVR